MGIATQLCWRIDPAVPCAASHLVDQDSDGLARMRVRTGAVAMLTLVRVRPHRCRGRNAAGTTPVARFLARPKRPIGTVHKDTVMPCGSLQRRELFRSAETDPTLNLPRNGLDACCVLASRADLTPIANTRQARAEPIRTMTDNAVDPLTRG